MSNDISKDLIEEEMIEDLPTTLFPSNSHKSKEPIKKVKKIVKSKVTKQKKGLGRKFSEAFLGDDGQTIGSYILHDVLVPAAKSMICDMIGWGGAAEMFLFGDKRGGNQLNSRRRGQGSSRTSYGSYYNSGSDIRRDDRREISRSGRSRHNFDEIIIESRGEAEEVIFNLADLIERFGVARVADLYEMVGITGYYTDDKYGWTELRNTRDCLRRVRGGYLLNLPKPHLLDY